jgi:O-antigen/teichoic acid export membrane protein
MDKPAKNKLRLLVLAINFLIAFVAIVLYFMGILLFFYVQLVFFVYLAVQLISNSFFYDEYFQYFKKHNFIFKVILVTAITILIIAILAKPTFYLT